MTELEMDVRNNGTRLAAPLRNEKRARAVLSWLFEPGDRRVGQWVAQVGAVEVVEKIGRGEGPDSLVRRAQNRTKEFQAEALWRQAAHLANETGRCGAQYFTPDDDEWPSHVDDLSTVDETWSPLGLWKKGDASVAESCASAVAVVGARASTDYGNFVAREISYGLATRGFTVISGAAYGIDAASHRGALAADGCTVAVLASGVDVSYPTGNDGLLQRISTQGVLLSEWPPGTPPARHRFLVRNRLIAALGIGTVVVEAARRSGSLSTARYSSELGRAIMAVPGSVTSAMSEGCHEMIRQWGAELVTNAAQISEHISPIGEGLGEDTSPPPNPRDLLDDYSRSILDAFPSEGAASIDNLVAESGVDSGQALATVGRLAGRGWLVETSDGWRLTAQARKSERTDASPRSLR